MKASELTRTFLYKHKKVSILTTLCILVALGTQFLLPFFAQEIVDNGIEKKQLNLIVILVVGQLSLHIGRIIFDLTSSYFLIKLGNHFSSELIMLFFKKIFLLPITFFDRKNRGHIFQLIDDHFRIENLINSTSIKMTFSVLNLLVFGFVLVIYDLKMFLIFALGSALYIIYVLFYFNKIRELDQKEFHVLSESQNNLFESIFGIQDIKSSTYESKKTERLSSIQNEYFSLKMRKNTLLQYQEAGSVAINEFKNAAITFISALAVVNGSMTLGMMIAVQYVIGQLNAPLSIFLVFSREFSEAKISLGRIDQVHELDNERKSDGITFKNVEADIQLNNVSFSYPGFGNIKVLNRLNFLILKGKVTALVGASGCGKTTLVKLLLKFYNPEHGSIKVNDTDLSKIDHCSWRNTCGVVSQDGYLFSDSIAGNIALDGIAPKLENLIQAARIANILSFIEKLPDGFNTKIGSEGVELSQGQKQRILIARAIYKSPQILFLDEATSSLDTESEKEIIENLERFLKGRTVLIIAHRLSTIRNADQIIVMQEGKVVEVGDHNSLVEQEGIYYRLIKNQLEFA